MGEGGQDHSVDSGFKIIYFALFISLTTVNMIIIKRRK